MDKQGFVKATVIVCSVLLIFFINYVSMLIIWINLSSFVVVSKMHKQMVS